MDRLHHYLWYNKYVNGYRHVHLNTLASDIYICVNIQIRIHIQSYPSTSSIYIYIHLHYTYIYMFRLPSWKHHWNPSSFPQTRTDDKGRPTVATHGSGPVDAQESRARRNPVQSNSWVHNRWEFVREIMENPLEIMGKSWKIHGKWWGSVFWSSILRWNSTCEEVWHTFNLAKGTNSVSSLCGKNTSSVHPPFLAMKSPLATGSMHFFLLQTVQNHFLFIVEIYQMLDMLALY